MPPVFSFCLHVKVLWEGSPGPGYLHFPLGKIAEEYFNEQFLQGVPLRLFTQNCQHSMAPGFTPSATAFSLQFSSA